MSGLKALALVFACVLATVENITGQPTPCDSEPCQNNGWCAVDGGSYQCSCRPGFTGVNCETQVIRKLAITVKSTLYDLFIDGVRQNLTNANNWTLADEIVIAPTNRLVALMAVDSQENCGGVIASVTDDFLVTDSRWKCNRNGDINWQKLGFNDTLWPSAWELGSNYNITEPSGCNNVLHGVPPISPNANWIWDDSMADPPLYHSTIYCRQYIPICEYESPCLNGGTCNNNSETICSCHVGYTGQYCENVIRKLTITVKSTLYELYIDGVRQNLTNRDNWTLVDEIVLAPTNRLVALMAVDTEENCAGVIASVTGDFLVTDSQWRCNINGDINWQDLGFNDTLWPPAWELGSNYNITRPSGCNNWLHGVPPISPNANWIWVESMAIAPTYHHTIYCRQHIPICEYESPCLNGGTCNNNSETICSCHEGYTGKYCENVVPPADFEKKIFPTPYPGRKVSDNNGRNKLRDVI